MGFGLAFCVGILLFFAGIAALNIVLIVGRGVVFQWGDLLRNSAFVTALSLLMVVLGLFMFGVFTIGIPASVTSKTGGGNGYAGSVGMGFLAAILATPCSFAILAAAIAWAQTQSLPVATLTIMLIGSEFNQYGFILIDSFCNHGRVIFMPINIFFNCCA